MRSSHCGGWKSSVSLSFLRITLLLQPLTQQFGIYIFLNILKRSLILIINKHGPSFSSKFYQFILVSLNWDERNKNLICYYKRHKLNESITQTNCLARLTKIVFSKYRGREESVDLLDDICIDFSRSDLLACVAVSWFCTNSVPIV